MLPKVKFLAKFSIAFFIEIDKKTPKIHMKPQQTLNSYSHLEQEEQSVEINAYTYDQLIFTQSTKSV